MLNRMERVEVRRGRLERLGGGGLDGRTFAVLATLLVAVVLLAYFDLQTDVPLLDEYARQWTLKRIASGSVLGVLGTNPGLVQILVAAPLALLHLPPRVWRLTEILALVMLAAYSWRLARRLGAGPFWGPPAAHP